MYVTSAPASVISLVASRLTIVSSMVSTIAVSTGLSLIFKLANPPPSASVILASTEPLSL